MSVAPADSASHAPAVHLRPSTPRVSLAGGQLRLLALAGVLFGALGARVHHEEDAAIPAGLRPAALSWLLNHDEFLCDLAVAVPDGDPGDGHPRDSHLTDGGPGDGDGAWSGMRRGSAAVLCDDAPALARRVPGVPPL
ncbi:MAG TPA: hypothetical protein VFP72_22260, partial [Kineosporiaceae bacterium]|nr:hypothetical protein [Kineosporiaceae bacterium]